MPILNRFQTRPLALVSCLFLLAAGCSDRLAGTSTTTENTLTGVAMLPGGTPAAGAMVSIRGSEVVLAPNRAPQSRLLGLVYADSSGTFAITLPRARPFFLEIRRAAKDSLSAAPDSFPESWFGEFPDSTSKARRLGSLVLEKSISLHGRLKPLDKPWVTRAWVGIQGTDNFRSLTPSAAAGDSTDGEFTLWDVPARSRRLVVYVEPEVTVVDVDTPLPVDTVGFRGSDSGGVRQIGDVPFKPR